MSSHSQKAKLIARLQTYIPLYEWPLLDELAGLDGPEGGRKMAYATPEAYAAVNPLGGPAVIFEAMAKRIRAGEDFYSVLDDYGLQSKPEAGADDAPDYKALHTELIMAVARKYPGESRHQTALRYINEAERQPQNAGQASKSNATPEGGKHG